VKEAELIPELKNMRAALELLCDHHCLRETHILFLNMAYTQGQSDEQSKNIQRMLDLNNRVSMK